MSKKKNKKKKSKNFSSQQNVTKIVKEEKKTNSENQVNEQQNKSETLENEKKNISLFKKILNFIKEKQLFSRLFIIIFATFVFSYIYTKNSTTSREALAYIGVILYMVICYTEVLGRRDHLWVIEGSIPESRRWREIFFNPSNIRKHKFRKIIVVLFAFIIFTAIYKKLKRFSLSRNALSFLGIILMITVVYYEILTVRDEVNYMIKSLEQSFKEKERLSSEEKDFENENL